MPYSGAPDIDQLASELDAKVLDLKRRGKFTPDDEKGYAEVQRLIKERKRDRLMEQDATRRETDFKAEAPTIFRQSDPSITGRTLGAFARGVESGTVALGTELANLGARFGPNAGGGVFGGDAVNEQIKRTEEWKRKIQQGLALPPDATVPEKAAGFVGGAVPALGAIALAGPEAAPVVAPALFGLAGAGRALGEGATEDLSGGQTAARTAGYGAVGVLAGLPLGAVAGRFAGPAAAAVAGGVAPKLAPAIGRTLAEAAAGGAGMGGQVLGENVIAQQTGSPERKTWEGVGEAALGGAAFSGGMHGLREVSIDAKATKVRAEQARQEQQAADVYLSQATTPEELDLLVGSLDEIPPHVQERIPVRRAQLEQEAAQAQQQAEEAAANPPDPQVAEADRIAKLITGVKSGEPAALDELMNDALRAAAVLKDPASTKEAKDQAQKFLDQRVDGQKSVSSLLAKYRIDNGVGEPPKGAAELKKWTENRERREMDRLGAGGEVAPAGPSSRGPMSAAEWKGPIDNPEQQRVLPGREEAGTPTPLFSEPTQTWTTPETPEARAWREREQARIDKQRIQAENDAKWEAEKSRRRLAEETKARIKAENDAKWEAEKARREEAKRAKEAVDSQLQAEQQASVLQRDKELNSLPDELLAPISKHAPDQATKIAAERILNERKLERQRQQAAARPLPEKAPPTTPIQKELPVKKSGSVTPPPQRVPLQGEAAAPAHEVVQEQDQSPAVGVRPDLNALPERLAATGQFTPEQIALVNKMLGGATDTDGNPVVKPGALDERSPITRPTPQQQQNATQRAHVNAENKDEARRLGPEPPPSETEMDDMARSYGQDEPPPADQPSLGEGSPGGVKYSTSPEGQKPVGDGPYMYLDDNGVLRRTRVSPADIKQMQEEARKMAGLPGLTLRGEMWSKGDTEAERRALEAHGVSKEDIAKRGPQRLRGLSTATAIEVSLALERHDIVNANRHEIGHHALEAMSPELRTAVIQDMGQITPKPRVGAETKAQRIGRLEEAFCDNLAGWLGNEKAAPTPALRRAVDAIRRMFDVMGDYLRSKGFKSLGDVFGDAEGAAKRRVEKTFRDVSEGKFAKGGVSGEKAAVRRGEAPGFFSGLRRIIDQKMPARATPEQVKAIIASAKREEADWTGLTDWLAEQNGPITKEQLQQFLAENDVRVQEVELSDNMEHVVDREAIARFRDVASKLDAEAQNAEMRARGATGQMAILARDDARAARAAADMAKRNLAEAERGELKKATDTKYGRQSNLLTPGGENQRELLLTLPRKPSKSARELIGEPDWARPDNESGGFEVFTKNGEPYGVYYGENEADVLRKAREIGPTDFGINPLRRRLGPEAAQFTAGHYDEPNVLAHVRFNERTGPNGERILHVEEIQSDWHQKGRREGYSPRKPVRFQHGSELERLRSKAGGHGNLEIYTSGNVHDERMGLEAGLTEAEIARAKELLTEKARIEQANLPGSIPDAPFKTSWHELAFKRMLRYAAENGYDKLTWTTGEQQADRYDLSKQVDSIHYYADAQQLEAMRDGGVVLRESGVTPDKLPGLVGKDAAEKLLSSKPRVYRSVGDGDTWRVVDERDIEVPESEELGEIGLSTAQGLAAELNQRDGGAQIISGNDLKVGGEGMKGFYDKILVDFANKYGKKWGAKVGTSDLNFNESGEWRDAETGEQRHTLVHSIDITPQMKDSVLGEGQPKFSVANDRTHIVHGDSGPKKIRGVKLSPDLKTVSYEYWSEAEQAWKPESRSAGSFFKMAKGPTSGGEGARPPGPPAPPASGRPGTAAPRGGEPSLRVREETRASRLRQLLQDNLARLLHIQEDIVGSGRTMKPEHNAYLALEAKNSKTKYEMDKFRDNHIKPMLDELDKAKISLDEMGDYVYARHAKQANEHVASINPDKPTGGSGMTDERAQEILDGVRKDPRRAVFESVAKKFDAVVEMTRQRLIDAGLETPEKVQMWREMFDSYVALKGTATEGGQRKGGAGIRGPESKRRMGRSSEAFNPFVQVLADGYEKIVRAEANKSYQPLLDLAEAHPDPETWAVFSEDSPEQGKRLKVWYENPETLETSSKPKNGYVRKAEVVKTPDNLKMYGSDYLGVKRNGKQYFIGIRDKSLREALIGMPPGSAEKVIAPIRFATRLYSSLRTTYSPLFWARNLPRDLQTAEAFVAAEKGKGGRIEGAKVNPSGIVRGAIKTMPEVYRHLHGKGESNTEIAKYITEGREDGVKTDWIDAPDAEQLYKQLVKELNPTTAQKTIHALDTPFRFLRSINDVVENATRFSVYIECRKAGVSRAMSAHMAKNATVNFERHGSLGPIANAFYAFANAGVQGSWNSLKMGRTNTGKVVFGGVIGLGALLAQYNHMVSDKDKDGVSEYSKILKADRGSNLIIMDPSGNGYTKIPFMRGLNVLLNAGTALADWMNDEMSPTQSAAFVTGSVLDAMSPIGSDRGKDALGTFGKTITPSIGRDTMDIITNTNFYGAPIYPESGGKAPKPDSSMAQRDTPEPYKKFVKWLNEKSGGNESVPGWLDFHPESLEYAAMALVGGVYREASNFGTLASKGPKATPPNRFPGKNIFRGATSPVFDSQQFKERETKLLQMEKHAKTLTGPERTKAVDWVVLNSVKSTSKQIDALRDRLDKINARVVKTPQQLQAQMTEAAGVEQQIQDAYKKFNKLYNERIGKHE